MNNCPGCGHENRKQAAFCAECGTRLTDTTSQGHGSSEAGDADTQACPSCSQSNKKGAKFCRGCGAILLSRTRVTSTSPSDERADRAPSQRISLWAGMAVFLIAALALGGYVLWGALENEPTARASDESLSAVAGEVDPSLGSLEIENRGDEPVRVFIEGQEIYTVPAEWSYVFHNLPVNQIDVRAVGARSGRVREIGPLSIDPGGRYEVVLEP